LISKSLWAHINDVENFCSSKVRSPNSVSTSNKRPIFSTKVSFRIILSNL
jgi:hypothetical protein